MLHALDGIDADELSLWVQETLGLSETSAQSAIRALTDETLLLPRDDVSAAAYSEAIVRWEHFGWIDAFRYVAATRDLNFLDYANPSHVEIDAERMAGYERLGERPSVYKRYPGCPVVPLERDFTALDGVDFAAVIVDDLAEAPAQANPLSMSQVSVLLLFTLGQTGTITLPNQGDLLLKAVPSGGARHPVEGYLLTLDTETIQPGSYHYAVDQHALELVQGPPSHGELLTLVPEIGSGPAFQPKAVLVFAAKLERPMWRYRDDSRSFRVVLHDVGHIIEQVKLVARAVGLVAYVTSRVSDQALTNWLGLDSDECLLDCVLLA